MNIKKSTLAVAVSALIGLGVASGQASASIYAGSRLLVQNVSIFISEDGGANQSPNAAVSTFKFTSANTAKLNDSPTAADSQICFGLPSGNNCNASQPRLDAVAVNAVGSAPIRANGDFSFFGPGTDQYANADSEITSAQLTGDPVTVTKQIAEMELQTGESALANAELTSLTGFEFTFVVSGSENNVLVFSFEADPSLLARIDDSATDLDGATAQANMNASFTLSQDEDAAGNAGTQFANWNPQGTAANDCRFGGGVACSELADAEDLNNNVVVSTIPLSVDGYSRQTVSPFSDINGWGSYGIVVNGLQAGTWTLGLNTLTSGSVTRAVPEPGVLAMFGVALTGLGFARRRKSRKA